jgi:integrase
MNARLRYSLSKRPTNAAEKAKKAAGKRWRGVWYVRWRRPDGRYSSAKSTGHENKTAAIDWCESQIDADVVDRPDVTLGEYSAGFFDWPDGRYAIDRKAGGHRASYRSAQSNRTDFKNHVLRLIPPETLVREITRVTTRQLRDALFREDRAPSTINHVVNSLSVVMQAAEEDGIIPAVPPYLPRRWEGEPSRLPDARGGAVTLRRWQVARQPRQGRQPPRRRYRAPSVGDSRADAGTPRVHREYIDVRRVWDRNAWRLKDTTKNEQPRVVPVSKEIRRELAYLIHANPHGRRGYVFWDATNPRAPMDPTEMTAALYRALESIGMSAESRKAARVDFHSWRHFANSRLVESGIPETTVRAMIGHRSADMTLNYYHASELAVIAGVQGALL